MSQLNVDALASQTGSLVSMASGHTLIAWLVQFDGVTRLGNSTTGYQLETTSDTYGGVKLVQNASGSFADLVEKKYLGRQADTSRGVSHAIFGIFTPGVTSAVTVKLQAKSWRENGSHRFRVNWYDAYSSLMIMEVNA